MTESGQQQDDFRHGDDRHTRRNAVTGQPTEKRPREQAGEAHGRQFPAVENGHRKA
ncbi:hypothetical protein ABQJ54_15905 [Rhodanobacter sp. Si-c]|uniref:Stress-induced protein n=1 Tax=Rhodanobacter lycopersici TaxID=3162487 RepID=A0ABV3QHC0_9GAMM